MPSDERTLREPVELSIIVLTYEQQYELHLLLQGLASQQGLTASFEVVVVDDGSSALERGVGRNNADTVAAFRGVLRIIHVVQRHCGNRAANRCAGVEHSAGARLLFFDGDMIPVPNFLRIHLDATDGARDVVSIGRRWKMLEFDRRSVEAALAEHPYSEVFAALPAIEDERAFLWHFLGAGTLEGHAWIQLYSHTVCLWREAYEAVEGFDPEFARLWGAEDIELGYRLERAGYRIVCNRTVGAFHVHHPVAADRHAAEQRRSLEMFFTKHPHWDVELYLYEPLIWSRAYLSARRALAAGEHLLQRTELDSELGSSAGRTISIGVTDAALLRRANVECLVATRSVGVEGVQELPLIGTRLPFEDQRFDCALISANLDRLSMGLVELVLREVERVAKRLVVVGPSGVCAKTSEHWRVGGAGRREGRRAKKVLVTSSPDDWRMTVDHANLHNLALALAEVGADVRMRDNIGERPPKLDRKFYHVGGDAQRAHLEALYEPSHDYLREVPNISNELDTCGRSAGANYLWRDREYLDGTPVSDGMQQYDCLLYRREMDAQLAGLDKRAAPLPVGVPSSRLAPYIRPLERAGRGLKLVWTCHAFDELCGLDVVVDAFRRAFAPESDVELTLFIAKYDEPRVHVELNDVLARFENERLVQERAAVAATFRRTLATVSGDPRIVLREGNCSDHEIWGALAVGSCLIDTHPRLDRSPVVLDAVALGRRVILPDNGSYRDVLDERAVLPVKCSLVSSMFGPRTCSGVQGAGGAASRQLSYRVDVEALQAALMDLHRDRDSLDLDPEVSRSMREKYDWRHVAKELLTLL